jgi:multiple sugar transport system substrate-binding protein
VIDDPELADVIQRQWRARAEGEIVVQQKTSREIVAAEGRLGADAVIYPAALIGELAERQLIVSVPDDVLNGAQLAQRDVLELIRLHEVTWGKKTYAVAFGSPQLTLFYRADIFERLGLQPPQTWAEYAALAARLADRSTLGDLAPPADAPWYGTVEPLGQGWAGQVLLARAAAYARHRSRYSTLFNYNTMEPLIDGPPFAKALEELAAAAKHGPPEAIYRSPEMPGYSPHDVRREFLAGHCAMALTWPSRSKSAAGDAAPLAKVPTGLALLPGSLDVYNAFDGKWEPRRADERLSVPLLSSAGRLGSVTKESRNPQSALNVLVWLSGSEWSNEIAPHSRETTLYRTTHLRAPQAWIDESLDSAAAGQYADAVAQSQDCSVWLFSIRIPGRSEYLAALDDAVQQTTARETSPAESLTAVEALKAAADRWRQITTAHGVESQRRAYERSLGLEP